MAAPGPFQAQAQENMPRFCLVWMEGSTMQCKICENDQGNRTYHVREMMFGYRDSFEYSECSQCGCLQRVQVPADMAKYYPAAYYGFLPVDPKPPNFLKRIAKRQRSVYALWDRGLLGRVFLRLFPYPQLRALAKAELSRGSRILDVGAGSGKLLLAIKRAGLEELLGVDPFIERDFQYPNGLRIRKCSIYEVTGSWDLIMFHHSFEHFADPLETLRHCSKLLSDKGRCLIGVPTVSSFAWRKYRENWVQLDAPRHCFLHSLRSLELLAAKAGFRVEDVVYDSFELQFWGSEQYCRDIPIHDERSYAENPSKSIFSREDIRSFREEARALNARKEGDQAIFYLSKTPRGESP